jgi:hypothetical protein
VGVPKPVMKKMKTNYNFHKYKDATTICRLIPNPIATKKTGYDTNTMEEFFKILNEISVIDLNKITYEEFEILLSNSRLLRTSTSLLKNTT